MEQCFVVSLVERKTDGLKDQSLYPTHLTPLAHAGGKYTVCVQSLQVGRLGQIADGTASQGDWQISHYMLTA